MNAIVFVNQSAGTSTSTCEELREVIAPIFALRGIEPTFVSVPPEKLRDEASAAVKQGIKLVIACGGDGTVSSVAGALVGTDATLGVLPQGTLNHFAKDIGVPLELDKAANVIAQGHVETLDVGEVNGRTFINNSSLGMYPHLAVERDALRAQLNIGKWTAMAFALVSVFKRFPTVSVRLEESETARARKTPLLFVGNNEYQFDSLRIGSRNRLTEGQLSLYLANTQSRWGLLRLSLRALFGSLLRAEDLEASKHTELWVTSRRPTLLIATDGEVTRMPTPLHYRIIPRALRICVPSQDKSQPSAS
jgi:diacylglycerol kinase family enzyme